MAEGVQESEHMPVQQCCHLPAALEEIIKETTHYVSDLNQAAGRERTSACLLANSEPSAFRFCTMPSTLLELNSLKGGEGCISLLSIAKIRRTIFLAVSVCWSRGREGVQGGWEHVEME